MTGRNYLKNLDGGKYLFHGSDKKINLLEPRQAYDWVNGKKKKDGKPAVFATDFIDRAIFMALLRNIPGEHGSEPRGDKTVLRMNKEKLKEFNKAPALKGYVMVLPKNIFIKCGNDYRAEKKVASEFIVEVSKEDLPTDIEIFE